MEMSSSTTSYKAGTAESTVEFAGLDNSYNRSAAIRSFFDKNKRNLSMGLGILVLVVFIISIANSNVKRDGLVSPSPAAAVASKSCALLSERPSVATNSSLVLGNNLLLSSDDRKSLATFRGYLEFFHRGADQFRIKEREKYQLLLPQSIDWLETNEVEESVTCVVHGYTPREERKSVSTKTRRLKLTTNCAVIQLVARQSDELWKVVSGSIVYDAASDDGERQLGSCSLEPKGQLDFAAHHHYQCKQNQSLDCQAAGGYLNKDQLYIRLWIEELEFELNGNPDKMKDNEFSKPISQCRLPAATGESRR